MNKSIGTAVLSIVLLSSFNMARAEDQATASGPTDPQIAAIVVESNNVDIDAARLAESKTKNKEVKAFAKDMVRDHSSVNKKATALVKKLGVTPEENDTSKSLKNDGDKMQAKLKAMTGSDFDKNYVDNEVNYHQTILDAIDKTLIPNAKNAELKTLLEKTRPTVAEHLEHAKHMQASMNKAG
jgi:putative membrane protein